MVCLLLFQEPPAVPCALPAAQEPFLQQVHALCVLPHWAAGVWDCSTVTVLFQVMLAYLNMSCVVLQVGD